MAESKVIMPQMGESIFEGTITKWLKKVGDKVERDEPLFEISTDKVDSEIPSPAAGTLQEILVKEGATVQINTVVAVIGDGSAKPAAAKKDAPAKEAKPAAPAPKESKETKETAPSIKDGATPDAGPAPDKEEEEEEEEEKKEEDADPAAAPDAAPDAGRDAGSDRMRSSPLVRRIAKEHGVDLAALSGKGTGVSGRITKSDILSYIEQGGSKEGSKETSGEPSTKPSRPIAPPPPAMKFSGDVERVPLSGMRKSIAEHMVMSKNTSAHVTTIFEVDVTHILQSREKIKEDFERAGVHLTVTPFFVQAAVKALKKFPIVNSSLDGDTIVYKRAINIGIAVNVEAGLIVPVIRNADEKNLQGLAHTISDLGERARSKKLTPDDVKDSTFTITNPGQYGALIGTPIINQPNVAIMGMGGIKKRPVVINDAIAIRSIIYLSLSFDHRVIDGATADQFMAEVQRQLEHWPAV